MPTIKLADMAMAYDDVGAPEVTGAVPILFLHGAVQTRAIWSAQMEALASTRRIIAPDLRGHGETPLGQRRMSVPQMTADCLALLDRLEIPRAVVCGVSLGGMVALEMAALAPPRVAALVLANTPLALSGHRRVRRLVDWIDPQRLLRPAFGSIGRELSARIGLAAASVLVGPHWVGKRARHHFIHGFTHMSEDAIVATYRAVVESSPVDLNAIHCRCLIIDGSEDAPTIRSQAADIGEGADNARVATMDVGHVANLDDPETFNRLLMVFLQEHGRGRP